MSVEDRRSMNPVHDAAAEVSWVAGVIEHLYPGMPPTIVRRRAIAATARWKDYKSRRCAAISSAPKGIVGISRSKRQLTDRDSENIAP